MAGRYRALLIGNSTYPADAHNLQTLKGPVKDIATLNRALIDPGSGLFADADVTLLPEATSSRAIRALGRFFVSAARDDVLLVYFSGHGKLDQSGRLHLCMQDTDSTDLLSTAVSSARINEFADASHARNVVVVLDCCYAGAFRGGDFGQAVAGLGRYVLTSCRGTQLANDATVENGTSFFTQHLVDGLLQAAADQDQDGYVTFSDLYAYVDRRLREAGKQIPQRQVDGDGDVPLARRPQPAPDAAAGAQPPPVRAAATTAPGPGQRQEQPAGGPPPGSTAAGNGATAKDATSTRAASPPPRLRPSPWLFGAVVVTVAAGVTVTLVHLAGGSGANPPPGGNPGTSGTYTADAPWRLQVTDDIQHNNTAGCSVTLTDARSGNQILRKDALYTRSVFQVPATGSFQWHVSNPQCHVAALAGPGMARLPFVFDQHGDGDTDAFAAHAGVAVHVTVYHGNTDCELTLHDPANGQTLDSKTAHQGKGNDTVTLLPGGRRTAYLSLSNCQIRVTAAP